MTLTGDGARGSATITELFELWEASTDVTEIEERIAATSANTDAERAMKVRVVLGNGDLDHGSLAERMVASVLRDLAGPAAVAA